MIFASNLTVAISPAGRVKKAYSTSRKLVAKGLAKVAPNMGVAAIKTEYLFRTKEEAEKYAKDPLVYHGNMKSGTARYKLGVLLFLSHCFLSALC